MVIRKMRLKRGWSQDQLAQLCGLNIRTIQRLERGQNAGLESLKSLSAVFEIQLSELQQEIAMNSDTEIQSDDEEKAIEYVRDIKAFYQHLGVYIASVIAFFIINFVTDPNNLWSLWGIAGWGIGVASHGIHVFELIDLLGPRWERKQIEKRLGRKL